MTHIPVLGSTNTDLVAYVEKAPQRGETVTGREFRTIPGGKGALEHSGVTTDRLVPGDEGPVASADALLLQLEIPLAAVLAGARTARGHGVRTVLTPAPARPLPPELLTTVDPLVPNEHEAAALTGLTDPDSAATALLEQVPEVVVTLGAAGSLHAARGTEPFTVPAPRVTAVDSTGAGDTFVGTLADGGPPARAKPRVGELGEGRPMREALPWAATAAALSVQRPGASASMPYRSEIETRFTS
ncbi:PfkB family carbohydrate kinase [Streptomyces sp. V4I2]|uniref:PfkB family carbohydrate kinase n=1 Tax=Streptomyces sp. V4I2 TaxID=3042280 RepID=UPI00277D5BE8|nr:PfkB family carbohydrate kinase [Streptomyces sp. V4I2]MDQ1044670.1 ribokinase [Streptomyces sp. V4I2]